MVKGRIYKIANLYKNKKNNILISWNHGMKDGIGWLWTSDYQPHRLTCFQDGDAFVCLGKKDRDTEEGAVRYGIDTWYEALGPDGKVHRFTPAMRSTYFRTP